MGDSASAGFGLPMDANDEKFSRLTGAGRFHLKSQTGGLAAVYLQLSLTFHGVVT